MTSSSNAVELRQADGYRFEITFAPGLPALQADEPPPLGKGAGPSPVQLLAASVGNCLAASLLFALKKFQQSPEPLGATVQATVGRGEDKRLRVQGMQVRLTLGVPAGSLEHLDRALAQFEEFCTVTQSVRQSFPVNVEVHDAEGVRVK